MRVILGGIEASKRIIPAASWLMAKHLQPEFVPHWLNYGPFEGTLYRGRYTDLGTPAASWSATIADWLRTLTDPQVIFAVDDYFLNGPMDLTGFNQLLEVVRSGKAALARLCDTAFYRNREVRGDIIWVSPYEEYTVTAQWCIWDRGVLVETLAASGSAWDFEMQGSRRFNIAGHRAIGHVRPPLDYVTHSVLSAPHWPGKVLVGGNKPSDIDELISLGLLDRKELIYARPQ